MRRHTTWALLAAALAATLPIGDAHAQKAPALAGGATTPPAATPAVAAPPKPLSETLTGMPKAEYEAGKVLYADKDYDNAIVKFQRAYELSKDPRLLWNVAVCEKNLRRYSRMLTTLRRLLADGGPMLTDQDKKDADELAKTVEAFVSPLRLTVSEPGASVLIDDEPIGVSPLEGAVMVDVGTRKIRVTKAGYKDFVRSEQVAGGSDVVVVPHHELCRILITAGAVVQDSSSHFDALQLYLRVGAPGPGEPPTGRGRAGWRAITPFPRGCSRTRGRLTPLAHPPRSPARRCAACAALAER